MSWNYRLVKMEYPNSTVFTTEQVLEIKEVYYDKDGNINGYSDASVPYGETIEEVRDVLELMHEALNNPVLNHCDIRGNK